MFGSLKQIQNDKNAEVKCFTFNSSYVPKTFGLEKYEYILSVCYLELIFQILQLQYFYNDQKNVYINNKCFNQNNKVKKITHFSGI